MFFLEKNSAPPPRALLLTPARPPLARAAHLPARPACQRVLLRLHASLARASRAPPARPVRLRRPAAARVLLCLHAPLAGASRSPARPVHLRVLSGCAPRRRARSAYACAPCPPARSVASARPASGRHVLPHWRAPVHRRVACRTRRALSAARRSPRAFCCACALRPPARRVFHLRAPSTCASCPAARPARRHVLPRWRAPITGVSRSPARPVRLCALCRPTRSAAPRAPPSPRPARRVHRRVLSGLRAPFLRLYIQTAARRLIAGILDGSRGDAKSMKDWQKDMKTSNKPLKNLTLAATFLALGLVLPLLTGQIPQIGNTPLPMHIPAPAVRPDYCGLAVRRRGRGIRSRPLLRYLIFGYGRPWPKTPFPWRFELAREPGPGDRPSVFPRPPGKHGRPCT